jgi:O-antigen/teichoic acid export membrane protein
VAALLQACAPAAAGAVVGVAVWRAGLVAWRRPTAAAVRAALREGRHVFASTAAITLYTATNTVVLGFVAGNASVAIFAAADRIRLTLQGALTPLASAAYPRVSALMGTDRPAAFRLVRTLLVLQAGGMFVASAATFALAPWIAALFMGQATGPAVLVLRLMSVLPFVISFSNVLGVQAMLPMGLDAQFSRIVTVCGLVNVVLLLSLGAAFREVGAAVAVLVTETLVSLAMALALRAQLAGRGALARST